MFGGRDVVDVVGGVGWVGWVGWVTPGVRGVTLEGPWPRAGRKSLACAGVALPNGATMATLAARANRRLVVLLRIPPRVNTERRPCTATGDIAGLYPGLAEITESRRSQLAEVAHHRTGAPVSSGPAGHCSGVPTSRYGGPFGLDGAGLDAEDAHPERSELEPLRPLPAPVPRRAPAPNE